MLELGCASGNNLIPIAENMPNAKFVGIDYSEPQIAAGKKTIADLGLKNIELRQANIMDIGPKDGMFDYIIVHGIFSWVPKKCRKRFSRSARKT